jgi:peroxiredoxin
LLLIMLTCFVSSATPPKRNYYFMRKIFIVLTLIILIALPAASAETKDIGEGDLFPSLLLPNVITGKDIDVIDYLKGRVGAIVFMQTSCSACRKELKALKVISSTITDLKVIAISVDAGARKRVVRYREGFKLPFLFLHDPEFKSPEIFGISFTPALILVDKEGTIKLIKGGYRTKDRAKLEAQIEQLVN